MIPDRSDSRCVTFQAVCLLALLTLGGPAHAQAQDVDTRPGIAVLPFDVTQLPPTDLAGSGLNFGLQHMLLSELDGNPTLRIVERRVLNEVMQEFDLHGRGNVDGQTAAELGRIVFARYMVGTSYFDDRGEVRLDARVIDVETTEVIQTARVRGREQVFDLITRLAEAVTEVIDLPPLPEGVREARSEEQVPPAEAGEALRLLSLAIASEEYGDVDQAIEYLSNAIDRWPNYSEAVELRTKLLEG